MRVLLLVFVLIFLFALPSSFLIGCDNSTPSTGSGQGDDDDTQSDDDDDTSFNCARKVDGQTVGLFTYSNKASRGYTLFAPLSSKTTYLIDMCGMLVNQWQSDYAPGHAAYLLEDGSLIRTAVLSPVENPTFNAGGAGGRVGRMDWDGNLIWEFEYADTDYVQHHDIEVLPNGNVLMVAWELKTESEIIAAGRDPNVILDGQLWVDHIIEVEPYGSVGGIIVWEWHLWDHMVQDFDPAKANYGVVEDHPELIDINFDRGGKTDWTHSNAIDNNEDFDQIIISVLGFSELWIIDHSTTTSQAAGHSGGNSGKGGDLLYRWGNPQTYGAGSPYDQIFFYQHDTQWIEEGLPGAGNILAFNNGTTRPEGDYSSIEEIVLPVDQFGSYTYNPGSPFGPEEQEWTFVATPPQSMYSPAISGAQRLPNGNTLICVGNYGTIVEVSQEGSIVWEYVNPVVKDIPLTQGDAIPVNSTGTQNAMFRAYRYPIDFPGFEGKDMTSGSYLELE